jgi:hypothetical protein
MRFGTLTETNYRVAVLRELFATMNAKTHCQRTKACQETFSSERTKIGHKMNVARVLLERIRFILCKTKNKRNPESSVSAVSTKRTEKRALITSFLKRVYFSATFFHESKLVDPASSHMLVSKIKPCMYKFSLYYGETANGSLNQL